MHVALDAYMAVVSHEILKSKYVSNKNARLWAEQCPSSTGSHFLYNFYLQEEDWLIPPGIHLLPA